MVSGVVRGRHLSDSNTTAIEMTGSVEKWSAKFKDPNQSWSAVKDQFDVEDGEISALSASINYPVSPYKSRFRQGAIIVPRVLTLVNELPAGPLGVGAGRVRVESRRSSTEKKPWKLLAPPARVVESKFVREVHLGETLVPYRMREGRKAVLPISGTAILTTSEIESYGDLSAWWTQAEMLWDANKSESDASTLLERLDYLGQLRAQLPVAAHRVLYTKSGNNLCGARLSNSDAVIDHILYWGNANSKHEAQFLVGILNSATLLERVKPLQAIGLFGARHFDKNVFAVPFDLYDPGNLDHEELVELVSQAEDLATEVDLDANFLKARRQTKAAIDASGLASKIEETVARILPVVLPKNSA